mmetsp:Transcript_21957/g.55928  ORF Transcript_21957/g.55928 Transcript_21957/m.55928 type:complete len:213 (-) Transcript_21957:348-986(-)
MKAVGALVYRSDLPASGTSAPLHVQLDPGTVRQPVNVLHRSRVPALVQDVEGAHGAHERIYSAVRWCPHEFIDHAAHRQQQAPERGVCHILVHQVISEIPLEVKGCGARIRGLFPDVLRGTFQLHEHERAGEQREHDDRADHRGAEGDLEPIVVLVLLRIQAVVPGRHDGLGRHLLGGARRRAIGRHGVGCRGIERVHGRPLSACMVRRRRE